MNYKDMLTRAAKLSMIDNAKYILLKRYIPLFV